MKEFLVLGRCTAMGYKDINGYILDGDLWFGCTETGKMIGGDVHCYWFTNLVGDKKVEFIPLTKKYKEGDYRKMDFYDAINIDSIYDIPSDYDGVMGVPITFMKLYDRRQFEIVSFCDYDSDLLLWKEGDEIMKEIKKTHKGCRLIKPVIQGDGDVIDLYYRVFIKRK